MYKKLLPLLFCLALFFPGKASVVITDIIPDSTATTTGTKTWFGIDFNLDGTPECSFSWGGAGFSYAVNATASRGTFLSVTGAKTLSLPILKGIEPSVWIDSSAKWDTGKTVIHRSTYSSFANLGDKYIGVKFLNGADTNYGWILINYSSYYPATLTIKGYGYENTAGKGIFTPPFATDFTSSTTTTDTKTVVSFTGISTRSPASWKWSFFPATVTFMGGTSDTSQNPQVLFGAPGKYFVKLKVTNSAGSDSVAKVDYIVVNATPVTDFTATATTTVSTTAVTFSDISTNKPTAWEWTFTPATVTFTGGTSATSQNPQVLFGAAGKYTVKLKVTNSTGSDSATKIDYIIVNALPVADFTASTTTTDTKTPITFTDISANTPTAWEWTFNPATVSFTGGTGASSQNPQVKFDADGVYTVKLKAANTAGADSVTKTAYITVATKPAADFTASAVLTDTKTTITFTDISTDGPTSWAWTFTPATVTYMGGTSATTQNPQVLFNAPGKYTVELKATNAGGSNSMMKADYVEVLVPTSIKGYSNVHDAFEVYPNPAGRQITVNGLSEGSTIAILDIAGKLEWSGLASGKSMQINIAQLPKGNHILRVSTKTGLTASKKLVTE